jgi:perosamine synthetase
MKKKIIKPFYLDINKKEAQLLSKNFKSILASGQLILGDYTKKFENNFSKYVNTKYCVALNSGTTALQILLQCLIGSKKKIQVAVPSNTNFASVAAIIYAGGKPVYLDMCKKTFSPCYKEFIRSYSSFKFQGVVWVHIAGIISPDFTKILNFCKKKNIFLIEDCAHAHGSFFKKNHCGSKSNGGAFSFFPTKVMTTMEGGMISTNDKKIYKLALSLRNQGKRVGDFGGLHHDLGNSWRISEVAASIGIVQLQKLQKMLNKRRKIYEIYAKYFDKHNIEYCKIDHMDQSSNYKMIVFAKNQKHKKDLKEKLEGIGVYCGGEVYAIPCHNQPVFRKLIKSGKSLAITNRYCPTHFCPPLTSGMSISEAHYSAKKICEIYSQ